MGRLACMLSAVVLAGSPLWAQIGEGNLVRNPGFEEPAAAHAYAGWAFTDHGQDFARGDLQALDYRTGLKAAHISVGRAPQVYVCWAQHVSVPGDDALPDRASVWYRAADAPADLVLSYIAIEDGKGVHKGSAGFPLEKSRDWRELTVAIDPPMGTRDIQLELRAAAPGEFFFDDVSLVRTEQPPTDGKPSRLLFVGLERERLTDLWKEELARAGWETLSFETWDNLTPALLKQCRAVFVAFVPLRSSVTEQDVAIADMIEDYVKSGGGLMLTQNSNQIITAMTLRDYLAERFGTRILFEEVASDPSLTRNVGPWWADQFTYTDQVFAPLNQGVSGLVYQSHMNMGSLCGVLPFQPGEPWQVVLSAGPGSSSKPSLVGLEEVDRRAREVGFTSDVPLAGVRELGAGRVVYVGLSPDAIFARPVKVEEDRQVYEQYMHGDFLGKPNGLVRFYTNAFEWLSKGAEGLVAADLKLRKVEPRKFTTDWKLHRGIIGPRTTWSTGASTPDEYVAKARAAGLDFVVFLEDMARLKPDGFAQLKRDCLRLSTGEFLAVPGVTYQNSDGNNEYVFGEEVRLPSQRLLDDQGRLKVYPEGPASPMPNGEQTWLYQLLGFENTAGWYLFSENPYPHYDTRNVNAMAVLTQEGGKVLERVVDGYALQSRNGQLLWPQALTLMKDASEIDLISSGAYAHNVVGADGTKMLYTLLGSMQGRGARNLYPGAPCFGSTSITNGPIIELHMPRGDTDAQGDIYNPALQVWPLELKVTSDTGLAKVWVMDGDAVIREFTPGGEKRFSFSTTLSKERQRYIWVRATDTAGREAICRDVQCDSWLLRDQQCSDRNNQLLYSSQRRPDGSEFYVGYGGDTCIPDKGPWNGRVRPVGCFVFDKVLGAGSMSYDGSPENHPQASFHPYVVFGGKLPPSAGWSDQLAAELEGAPHVQPRRVVSSSEVLVGERILDGVFPLDARHVIHVWHTLYPVTPSRILKTTARCSFYLPKVDGVCTYLWDQSCEALQEIPVTEDSPYTFGIGRIAGWLGRRDESERIIVNGGKVTERAKIAPEGVKVIPFDRGDYLGLLNSVFGSLAVYSLTDGLVLRGDGVNYNVGLKTPPGVVAPGAEYRAKLLLVGMHRLVEDPAALAAQVAADYGLAGDPGYVVAADQGRVLSQDCVLSLAAGDAHCFSGRITGLAGLAGNLGSTLSGLNNRWCAVFQAQGEGAPATRIIPVEEGLGYAVLQAQDEGKQLFIGHPFIADNPQVTIGLARSKDWKTWLVEVHNPTEAPIHTRVSTNPHVQGFTLDEALDLAPGQSVIRAAGEAPVK